MSGTISGIAAPFSLGTNYYFAVAGTNDNVSVTFDPLEERNYTNTITLTGSGGSADVMLLGTGVPEPGIVFSILFLVFSIFSAIRRKK